jgi:hypothetical protein
MAGGIACLLNVLINDDEDSVMGLRMMLLAAYLKADYGVYQIICLWAARQ